MKQIFSILFFTILAFSFFSCNETESKKENNNTEYSGKPKIEFFNKSHDFGTLKEGEIVECTFKFKNTGTAPLKITYVDPDCGCTTPKYDKGFVLPGKEGKIKAVFDSNGFRNNIYKTIDLGTNADSTITELVITAFIKSNFKLN